MAQLVVASRHLVGGNPPGGTSDITVTFPPGLSYPRAKEFLMATIITALNSGGADALLVSQGINRGGVTPT